MRDVVDSRQLSLYCHFLPWGARRAVHEVVLSRIIVVVVALTGGLVSAGASSAQTSPTQPGGSASISYPPGEQTAPGSNTLIVPSGTTIVTISWDASCPPYAGDSDPTSWSWYITINGTYPDGRDAFDSGSIGPSIGSTSWSGHQGFGVSIEHTQDVSQTISWEVQLHCGSATTDPMTLASGSFTLTRCAPSNLATVEREFARADDLDAIGARELAEASKGYDQTEEEDKALDVATETLVKTLTHALEHVLSEAAGAVVEVAEWAAQLASIAEEKKLEAQNWTRLTDGAKSDFEQAKLATDRANADLAHTLATISSCPGPLHDQINELLAHQKLLEDARQWIDQWDRSDGLWVNPITSEKVSETNALYQAEAMLTGGPPTPGATDHAATASTKSIKANAKQLLGAIKDIDKAVAAGRSAQADLGHLQVATTTVLNGLKALLAT